MRKIGTALGPTINPGLLTIERLRYGGYRRREEINAAVLALAKGADQRDRASLILAGNLSVGSHLSHPSELPAVARIEIELPRETFRSARLWCACGRLQPVKINAEGTR